MLPCNIIFAMEAKLLKFENKYFTAASKRNLRRKIGPAHFFLHGVPLQNNNENTINPYAEDLNRVILNKCTKNT